MNTSDYEMYTSRGNLRVAAMVDEIVAVGVLLGIAFATAGCGGGGGGATTSVVPAHQTQYEMHTQYMRDRISDIGVTATAQQYGAWDAGWQDGYMLGNVWLTHYLHTKTQLQLCTETEMNYSTGQSFGEDVIRGCVEGINAWWKEWPIDREAWLRKYPPSPWYGP